jgi:hypothetical protein
MEHVNQDKMVLLLYISYPIKEYFHYESWLSYLLLFNLEIIPNNNFNPPLQINCTIKKNVVNNNNL